MFNGGHSRHSYPLDKRVPKFYKYESYGFFNGINLSTSRDGESGQRQVVKNMHKKKQRQHDKKLSSEWEE